MISTIKEVAERAGVSISTVSKVLKNYSNISEDTRQKVLKAVKELNYIPNTTASNLSSKNKDKVALYICINDMKQAVDEINMLYLQGAFAMANINHLELVTIFNQMVSSMSAQELTSYLAAQGITGIIIYGLNKEDYKILQLIEQQRFNICVIDAPITNDKTSSVMIDHMKGQYDVAKAIIEPEYTRKVLYLAGKRNGYVTDMRIQGIMQLQKELGFELNIQYAEFSEKLAYDLTLRYGSDVDTVVCASDLMAIGALNALIKMNIYRKCCGFDGITLMRYAGKGMLTCKQDFYDISRHAIAEMERLLSGENGRSVILDHQIVSIRYEDINTK
ncbi:MAG: LacI family DNA-binding transcriptional regulator [Erysipelotrichaceae bacterium]|nr:LacI family DNA-binding transcriptional regulator [Erysipelotrichaceae bacterium]